MIELTQDTIENTQDRTELIHDKKGTCISKQRDKWENPLSDPNYYFE